MKKGFFLFVVILCITTMANAKPDRNEDFNKYKEGFVLDLWQMYPGWASSVGYHKYDSVLVIPDDASRAKELSFCNGQLKTLANFDINDLNDANKIDYHLIENQLRSSIWSIQQEKTYQWDPSSYNVCGSFADMLANNYEPINNRLRSFYKRMANIPAYYEAAKQNIKDPTLEHTQLCIDQNRGGVSVFYKDLGAALKKSTLSQKEKDQITARATTATNAINNFADWLSTMPNKTPRSFRLGPALYDQKFAFDLQSSYTSAAIYEKAQQHKTELHEKMMEITKKLWPKYFGSKPMPEGLAAVRQMIDQLSLNHVKPEEFQSSIEKQLPTLVNFIKKRDLIYIDPSKPLVVRREPDYMAGVAGASVNSPGPYDKNGNTYYNVGSLDGWDKDKAESYLREYNHYILQILNIHEAIPGHYTQLVYANQSPSIIKSILGNNAMIEGWAVYGERMMLENGYDGDLGPDAKEASPEMWLMYYKWNLRSTCNTILDIGVHTRNMSQDDAMKLLTEEAFQQQAEAEGKWKRVSVTQVQLCCYFTGYTEIYDLREELKKKDPANFNLKNFHEQFLSYGSAPVKYIRQMMMNGAPFVPQQAKSPASAKRHSKKH